MESILWFLPDWEGTFPKSEAHHFDHAWADEEYYDKPEAQGFLNC
jgi:hypothetical protein